MILPFSTKINGKPTFFVEKIQTALRLPYFKYSVGFHEGFVPPNFNFYVKSKCKPKIHTIRTDENDRWKAGILIDFFINCRQKNMFRFAPRVPVVSVQKFQIVYYDNTDTKWDIPHLKYAVRIDNRRLEPTDIEKLALNDGFGTIEAFFEYFNEDYVGKIIHWTDFRY